MEAFRATLKNPPKQLTRREDGKASIFFVKTSWSIEFIHALEYIFFLFLITSVTLGRPSSKW